MRGMIDEHVTDVICIGLPGPTHHYGGLSADNVASGNNRGSASRPREAALQALSLAKLLRALGLHAAILPPHLRPHLPGLRTYFSGDDDAVIHQAARENPGLLEQMSSSAAMWTANAATVAPGSDCADGRLHLSVANLHSHLHRRIEAQDTYRMLHAMFAQVPQAVVHPPLDAAQGLRDEGAANHMRLAPGHGEKGLNVYVYGSAGMADDPASARQTLAASQAVAAQQQVEQALFIRQNPAAIAQGVFHNDVIAVSNENVLLVHEQAYAGMGELAHIEQAYAALHPGKMLHVLRIAEAEISVAEAVQSYFFNSQIVTLPTGGMAIIAPLEVKLLFGGKGAVLLEAIRRNPSNPVTQVEYADLRQSMRNGGGPACLRLRVPMTDRQLAALRGSVNMLADDALLASLTRLVEKYYPEALRAEDLGDPALYQACRALLEEMGKLMRIPLP